MWFLYFRTELYHDKGKNVLVKKHTHCMQSVSLLPPDPFNFFIGQVTEITAKIWVPTSIMLTVSRKYKILTYVSVKEGDRRRAWVRKEEWKISCVWLREFPLSGLHATLQYEEGYRYASCKGVRFVLFWRQHVYVSECLSLESSTGISSLKYKHFKLLLG